MKNQQKSLKIIQKIKYFDHIKIIFFKFKRKNTITLANSVL